MLWKWFCHSLHISLLLLDIYHCYPIVPLPFGWLLITLDIFSAVVLHQFVLPCWSLSLTTGNRNWFQSLYFPENVRYCHRNINQQHTHTRPCIRYLHIWWNSLWFQLPSNLFCLLSETKFSPALSTDVFSAVVKHNCCTLTHSSQTLWFDLFPPLFPLNRLGLEGLFDKVFVVDVMDSEDQLRLSMLRRPELGITFTKLHCWTLTQYSKCVFLDADTLVSWFEGWVGLTTFQTLEKCSTEKQIDSVWKSQQKKRVCPSVNGHHESSTLGQCPWSPWSQNFVLCSNFGLQLLC